MVINLASIFVVIAISILGVGYCNVLRPSDHTTRQPGFHTTREDLIQRQRQWLSVLQQNFLSHMGWDTIPTRNASVQDLNAMEISHLLANLTTTERLCYQPSCIVPSYINRTFWNEDDGDMKLFFNPIRRDGEEIVVQNATLTLFIKPKSQCQCPQQSEEEDTRLIIEVSIFTRRRRRGPLRAELVTSEIVQWGQAKWLRIDVPSVAAEWIRDPDVTRRGRVIPTRYGLKVSVFRLDSHRLFPVNASHVFAGQICNRPRASSLSCLDPASRANLYGNYSPILEVFTENTPVISNRNSGKK